MKLNLLFATTLLSLACTTLIAQTPADSADAPPPGPWKTGGLLGLNFSQTYLENWQGGGQNSITGTAIVNLFANYKKDKWTWDNTLDAAYGLTRLGDAKTFQKTDDRLELNSKVGRQTPVINTYYAAMATFRTQMDAGYDYETTPNKLISDPFSPAYLLLGLGIDYKPSEAFSLYISPVTAKITIVDNQRLADAGGFGVEPAEYDASGLKIKDGETVRYEIGGFLKAQYTRDIMENVKLNTKIDLFSNYLENPTNIDINWETLIAMKINKYLSTSLSVHVVYDDDVSFDLDRDDDGINEGSGPRTQLKEVFSLGIQYQFSR